MTEKTLIARLKARYSPSPWEKEMAHYYRAFKMGDVLETDGPIVSLQFVDAPFYYCLFAEVVTALRKREAFRAEGYLYHSLRPGSSRSLRQFIRTRLFWNAMYDLKWKQLYFAFCDRLAYRSGTFVAVWKEIEYLCRSIAIWRGLRSKKELSALRIKGVLVGDLVIDSFLRFKPSPVMTMKDFYLVAVLQQAHRDVDKAIRYFGTRFPKILLTSYTTYIQHGVAARVALSFGTRVVSFGNFQDLYKTVTCEDVSHARNFDNYSTDFSFLSDQPEKLAFAGENIANRLGGEIDSAICYMKNSAYVVKTTDVPDVRGALVMFLHDFYDSCHIYDWMVFEDLWEWICFTLEHCEKAGLPLFIKPHPNQFEASESDFKELRKLYPDMRLISADVTNQQLADAGMACAVTVRGSVASEMAYMGVPTISAGNHPHASFDCFFTPRTPDEYAALLDDYRNLPRDPGRMKEQACAFYYMHNLNQTEDEKDLRDFAAYWNTYLGDEENLKTCSFDTVREALETMRANPAFQSFIDDLAGTLAT